MSVPIFLSYIDYCKKENIDPNIKGLNEWNSRVSQRDKRYKVSA